jgi:hypothetical protein
MPQAEGNQKCSPTAGVDWNMVAKYVDISDALPTLDAAEDSDKGSDSASDRGGGAADEPSRRVTREVQGSHASWTERIGLAQVRLFAPPTQGLSAKACAGAFPCCLHAATQCAVFCHTAHLHLQQFHRQIKSSISQSDMNGNMSAEITQSIASAGGGMVCRPHAQHDGGAAAGLDAAPLDRRPPVRLLHHPAAAAGVRGR